ncbi:MAG: hypothetical protein DWQ07_19235 [Chloroflexi bacterium]|nr:MAG: hypothetical protein DWQ07_19235 [Chloroflexota bacterium]MBL1195068.1 hypothetical protein [Chloroflexota bacterium]
MKSFVGDVDATNRELSTEDLKEFFGIFLAYKRQVNEMNEQVIMIGNSLSEALEKEGITLSDLPDSTQE